MYASCRMYRLGAGSIDDAMHKVDVDMAEEFSEMPGFVSYHVIATDHDEICSWTVFTDAEGAHRAMDAARKFVDERMSDFKLERIGAMTGEVMVGRARQEILEPAHH
jgi:hypothetical protein